MTAAAQTHDNRHAALHGELDVTFKVTMPASEKDKFLTFWSDWKTGDKFDRRQQLRNADIEQGRKSLAHLMNLVMHVNFTCGQSYVVAGVLAGMYNGDRVKPNLFDLKGLDSDLIEHLIHVLRLHHENAMEIHQYLPNGSVVFEKMISAYRLERKRRAR